MARERPYRKEICEFCGAATWCEIMQAGGKERPMCRGCKVVRYFTKILYPPLGYTLMPWQEKALRDLYGTVDINTGLRDYRHAYISVAKQNGKSFLIGGLPIYHLMEEREKNPEAYGCAAAKEQAGIVFKSAAQLVKANPQLSEKLKVLESVKKIVAYDGSGTYTVLAADGNFQDGIRPSLLLRDELHRWKTQRAKVLYDVTTKGQVSRNEPLDIAITTAGAQYESPLWYSEYERSKKIISGSVKKKSYYALIYEPDLKRIEKDTEYWKSREARVAANPSHEDLGGFLRDTSLVEELDKALSQPAEKQTYLRYNLNVPTKQEEEPIIEFPIWQENGGGVNLESWATYDVDLLVRKWNLLEQPCYIGVDASWSIDFTAVVLIFPPFDKSQLGPGSKDKWSFVPFFWIPRGKIPELERVLKVPIATWVQQGFIETTPGRVIDQRAIKDKIRWATQMFNVIAVAYDRCNFRSEALSLGDEGIPMVEVSQTFMGISQATKFFLTQYLAKSFRHGNNPVLNWMASCLQVQHDKKDNVQPSKPERQTSQMRIDGVQAIVTGLSQAIIAPAESKQAIEVW